MARFKSRKFGKNGKKKWSKRVGSFVDRHEDKLWLGAKVGGGLLGTYASLKGANMMFDEASELGENIQSRTKNIVLPVMIGGFMIMMMMTMM